MSKGIIRYIRNRIRLPLAIIKCRLLRIQKPLVVLFYVTDRCNLSCRYCVGNWSARKIHDLSLEEIKRIIDQCAELGSCHFTIHGGEILVRNDTKEIIGYLKSKGMYVNVVTNGILLEEKISDLQDVDSLCISLDGREENNDYTRGAGSYKKIMRAIHVAKENAIKFVVHATLTKRNLNDIEYLAEQAKEIGYYQQFSLLLKPLSPAAQELFLSDAMARSALQKIKQLKKKGYPIFTSYRVLDNALHWPLSFDRARLDDKELAGFRDKGLIPCYYGRLKIAIDADGYLYPCSSLNDTFPALNVKEVGVKAAYEHVLKTNRCSACIYLTQNEWSLLLGMDMRQFINQAVLQIKGIFHAAARKGNAR